MEVGQRQFSLRGGRIILHTQSDDRHGIWQCRLRLGTERKLVWRSTKTTDLAEARVTAEELYEELRFMHRNNHPLKSKTFKQVAGDSQRKAARDTAEGRLSKGTKWRRLNGDSNRLIAPQRFVIQPKTNRDCPHILAN